MTKMPFSPGAHGAPSGVTTFASIPASGTPDEPGLIGRSATPYGLPTTGPPVSVCQSWSMTGAVREDLSLQPLPRGRVQDLAGGEEALERRTVVLARGIDAVAHQQARRRRRREHAAHPVHRDDPVEGLRVRVVQRALVRDRGAADEQRREHDVAVADDPADVGGRPPDVLGEAEHPARHRVHVDLVAAVRVHRELRLRGGGARGEDVGRLVRLHVLRLVALAVPERQEVATTACAVVRATPAVRTRGGSSTARSLTRPSSSFSGSGGDGAGAHCCRWRRLLDHR